MNNGCHPMSVETDHKPICGDQIRKDNHLMPTVNHLTAVDNPLMATDKHLTPIDIHLLSGNSHPMVFASVLI